MQKYPRGSRGSPAKGVVPVTVARVRISPSAPKPGQGFFLALVLFCGRRTARNRVFPRGRARRRQRGCPHSFPKPVRRRRFAVSQGNTSPSAPKPGQARLNTQFFFPYLNCIAEISRKRSAQYTLKTYLSEKFLRRRIK